MSENLPVCKGTNGYDTLPLGSSSAFTTSPRDFFFFFRLFRFFFEDRIAASSGWPGGPFKLRRGRPDTVIDFEVDFTIGDADIDKTVLSMPAVIVFRVMSGVAAHQVMK